MNIRDLIVSWADSPSAMQIYWQDKGAAAERAKIVAWLRAAADGEHGWIPELVQAADAIESRQHLRSPADGEPARDPLPDILVRNDADNAELMRLRTWAKTLFALTISKSRSRNETGGTPATDAALSTHTKEQNADG